MSLELSASGTASNPFFTQTKTCRGSITTGLASATRRHAHLVRTHEHRLPAARQAAAADRSDRLRSNSISCRTTSPARASAWRRGKKSIGPFQVGPVKVVPYGLGEVADWGEDIAGNRIQRAYGQAGVRASMPMWSVDPTIQSTLWNVNGIAHKVVLDVEFSYTNASSNVDQIIHLRRHRRQQHAGPPPPLGLRNL